MRLPAAICFAFGPLVSLALAGDSGLAPRPNSTDYPSNKTSKAVAIGALLAPAGQVKKIFPDEISRKYIIVEVALYPQDGSAVDVTSLDFALKAGADDVRYTSTPHDLASLWKENQPPLPDRRTEIHGETGVTYSTGNDPVNGRTRGLSTYNGVSVSNQPATDDPPPPPPYDPYVVEARAKEKALPEGETTSAVAGYLYFPRPAKKHKNAALELRYAKDGEVITLPLPSK